MPNIHPFLVHYPIALMTLAIIADWIGWGSKNEEVGRVGWWSQLAGTIGLVLTVGTGLLAEQGVDIVGGANDTVQAHEQLAFVSSTLFLALLLWRIGSRTHIPRPYGLLYLGCFTAAVVFLYLTAWYGGELVYHFGVGVRVP
jgi:uncharacterized membrane protein